MTSTAPFHTAFLSVACDVPEGQTLAEWRRDRAAARLAERRARRTFRLPRPRPGRGTA